MTTEETLIRFVDNWRVSQGLSPDVPLTETQAVVFAKALQAKLASVSVQPTDPTSIRTFAPDATLIAYGGRIGDVWACEFARAASERGNRNRSYIRDTEAGRQLVRKPFYAPARSEAHS